MEPKVIFRNVSKRYSLYQNKLDKIQRYFFT